MIVLAVLIFAVATLSHMLPFPFVMEAFRPQQSIWHVVHRPGTPPTLYLTFDDGPSEMWTPPLLDALRDNAARGTFYLIYHHITPASAPIVRRLASEGHAIALHSGTRRLMLESAEELAAILERNAARIAALAGSEPCRLFRPHAGWRSATMYEGLHRAGYRLAGWSWGMWDWSWWRAPDADRLVARIARKASAGDIVVIHDGHHKDPHADRRYTGETVRRLVPLLRSRGFEFGTLCDTPSTSTTPSVSITLP